MIDKALARKLLPVVNDHELMELLKAYVSLRIEKHRDLLEQNVTPELSRGAIIELRRFASLRDEVIADSRD